MTASTQNVATDPKSQQASRDRAQARALEMVQQGVRPTLLRQLDQPERTIQTWSAPSRMTRGQHYLVDVRADASGVTTMCSCQAAQADRCCWHRCLVRLAVFGEISHLDGRRPLSPVDEYALSGKRAPVELADFVPAALAV